MYLAMAGLLTFASIMSLSLMRPNSPHQRMARLRSLAGTTRVLHRTGFCRRWVLPCCMLIVLVMGYFAQWRLLAILSATGVFVWTKERYPRSGSHSVIPEEQVEQLCMSLINSLQAGLSLTQALESSVERVRGPLSVHLKLALNRHQAGVNLIQSLEQMATKGNSCSLHYLLEILAIHQESGGQLTVLLALGAATIRERRLVRQELLTRTVEARLSSTILACLPIVITVIMALWQPDSLRPLIDMKAGRIGLVTAVSCWAGGILVVHHLIRGVSKEVEL